MRSSRSSGGLSESGATNGPMAASVEELSFQLTADALAEQERALNALRARAGTIVAAASISGSFLGAKAGHGSLDVWAILALITFVLCLRLRDLGVAASRAGVAFRGEALLGVSDQRGVADVTEAYRAAGIWIEPYLDANRDKIGQLSTWFTASCILLRQYLIGAGATGEVLAPQARGWSGCRAPRRGRASLFRLQVGYDESLHLTKHRGPEKAAPGSSHCGSLRSAGLPACRA
jgi:hypothetical protein